MAPVQLDLPSLHQETTTERQGLETLQTRDNGSTLTLLKTVYQRQAMRSAFTVTLQQTAEIGQLLAVLMIRQI
jgi:hypothetical protein